MSGEAIGWTFKRSPLSGDRLVVHLALADVANDLHENRVWLTRDRLAAKARCSRATVARVLADLVDRGMLEVVEEGGGRAKPTVYRFLMPNSEQADEAAAVRGSTDEAEHGKPSHREPLYGAKPSHPGPETVSPSHARALKDEPNEPNSSAAISAAAETKRPRRSDTRADAITREWWEGQQPRPMQKFVAVRQIVSLALRAGYEPDEIAPALNECDPPVMGWKLEQALQRRRGRRRHVAPTNPAATRWWENGTAS